LLMFVLLAGVRPVAAQSTDDLRKMLDANQAFALRDAVERGGDRVPAFFRGAVEESLNQVGAARRDLRRALDETARDSQEAFEADEMLGNLAFRNGQFQEALSWIERAHASKPDDADVNNMLPFFRALAEGSDMQVLELKASRLDCTKGLPVRINGKAVSYGFDTEANVSVIGVSDAKMLGLEVKHVATHLSEASGTAITGFDVAFAEDVVIGGLHLRNVPFAVLQDTGEPFVHVPVGERGLVGLQVLVAMKSIRWEPDKWFEFGAKARATGAPLRNVMFHGMTPIVRVTAAGKPLILSMDTGASDTDLNEGFAKALPQLVAAGRKEIRPITGMGGSNNYDSVLLGPVVFRVGGEDVTLKSPHVFPSHSVGKFDGNMGNDILKQAKVITLDFTDMELRLQ